ncbi:MAG: 2Fe-2S iron-sulfur cluster-binding protein [Gammaproteobacteria bacterium]|jgi:2Fe-2S ferredoxin|nr:2Fe-2S iron-sulfur cluster-binding protein [Gammaproteobacteria bacterium]MDB2444210.1 2Fe-2S iron-sulfur cluster-binding protein [Gammaproteobacteria bacterium]MDG0997416.1 2Fe-2S iron-sulfur cluster-binding protein [Gammaproteobacteria bacterium]MDG1951481.1 2Fe-2S iron-sulfur cluster-binding protein [Gammaproteobacteria bacterium]MDG2117651.1 2Fe-2S iron-sulfur cluster-binding protein [Gammaproteobacteria bacterium]|tara:strand:+ start:2342 stop:2662 length:321 start_codon:yes stop_codon:yes gene_type:complete
MVQILFKSHSGEEQWVEGSIGNSLMQVAVSNGVTGIDADCGGSCSCATCHVFVEQDWLEKLESIDPNEDAMLGLSPDRSDNSRLSCQIQITEDLDGLVVSTPEFQF